ncbi:MAG: ABC transporter permease [Candidatus Lokiarchaeota archaeon]|nr:ABC transporter permease [Candidatus Lokiarchaeota archaeon]
MKSNTTVSNNFEIVFEKRSLRAAFKERLRLAWTNYRRQCLAVIFFMTICLVITIWSLIPPFNDVSPNQGDNLFPSSTFWLGTNQSGQDVFHLLITGTRNSIGFGFLASIISTGIAIVFGVVGPYIGGVVEKITEFVTNVILIFPVIPFILLLGTLTQERTMASILWVIALFNWPWAARSIRAQVLSIKERDYIKISRMSGISSTRIAITEVLPNVLSYVFLCFVIITGIAIQVEAGIAMLGLGQQDYITLGSLLWDAQHYGAIIRGYYHIWIPPGLLIILFLVIIYNLHGSFSSTFNPKARELL